MQDGIAEWWERGPWQGQSIVLKARSAFVTAYWSMEHKASQIGGLPAWEQDAEYPTCPDCGRTMPFIGQLDNGDFPDGCYEGVYYAFLCARCRTTAVTSQQT